MTPRRYGGLSRPNWIVRLNCLLDYMMLVSVTVIACRPQVIPLNSDHVKILQFLVLGNTSAVTNVEKAILWSETKILLVMSLRYFRLAIIHVMGSQTRLTKNCVLIS